MASRYAILPHTGDHREARLARRGLEFNQPLSTLPTFKPLDSSPPGNTAMSFFTVDRPNIILETVKKAEKNSQIVLRLWVRCLVKRN